MNQLSNWIETAINQKSQGYPENEAFTELVRRYQDMVFGYVYAILREYHLAQDATQNVFIIVYRKLETLVDYEAFPYWLKQIAKRECLRMLKRQRQELPWENTDRVAAEAEAPTQVFETRETQNEIRAAIDHLRENQRVPVVLYYINGYSQQEVARFLNVETATVKKRLQRAREQMRKEMVQMVKANLEQARPSNDDQLVSKISLYTTFDLAAKIGQLEMLEQMLVDGVEINEQDASGRTLLHWAVESNHPDAVRLLLRNGADPELRDKGGKTAGELAQAKRNKAILRLFRL